MHPCSSPVMPQGLNSKPQLFPFGNRSYSCINKGPVSPPVLKNQMEKEMEHEMETGTM